MSVVKSPFSDFEVMEIPIHVAAFAKMAQYGDQVAMVDGITGREFTYPELIDKSHRVASGLARLGLKKGDIVSLFSFNTTEWVIMFWGVLCAGGTVTTVNPAYTRYELVHHLKHSGAKFVYTHRDLLSVCNAACSEVPGVKKIIYSPGNTSNSVSFESLVCDDGSLWPELEQLEFEPKDDVAIILYSSGTTGLPKGVQITHCNIMAICQIYGHPEFSDPKKLEAMSQGHRETCMVFLPFYHTYGLVGLLIMGMTGGLKAIILPKFEPHTFLRAIERFKITNLPVVPPVALFLAKSPLVHQYDLSSVGRIGSAGAPLSKDIEQQLRKRIKVPEMKQAYGLTESTLGVTGFGAPQEDRPGSCGVLLPSTMAKVVDKDTGRVLGPNQKGEIWIKGPQVMKGYLNNPQATKDAIDPEGFLHTGDIGYFDYDGYFYIVDRLKELIKVKAFQVAPAELEALLTQHPNISDAGVVGIPDERTGELPRAYIVKKPGVNITEQEIHKFVNERLTSYKHLKGGIQFIAEIPRLPSGKILRRKLKELTKKSKL